MFSSGPVEARLLQLEAAISEIKQVNADASFRRRIHVKLFPTVSWLALVWIWGSLLAKVVKRVDQLEFDSRRPHPGPRFVAVAQGQPAPNPKP